jgi:hypothetical protein
MGERVIKINDLTTSRKGPAAKAQIASLGLCLVLACAFDFPNGEEMTSAIPTPPAKVKTIEFFPVGPSETVLATYGSHNQKTVINRHGIFLTYVDQVQSGSSRWRLMRTNDEGATFTEVWKGISIGGAPVLDTDGENLFLVVPSERYPDATFMRFNSSARDAPLSTTISGGGDGHYNLLYDWDRHQLLLTTSVFVFVIDPHGKLVHRTQLFAYPASSRMEEIAHYPLLAQDRASIALAYTTTPYPGWTGPDGRQDNCYPSFGLMHTSDGGWSWTNPQTGTTLQTPIDASQAGPSYHPLEHSVSEMTPERCMANWLSGFLYKNSRILMALYSYDKSPQHGASATIPSAFRFMRYDMKVRRMEISHNDAELKAGELAVNSSQIFLSSGSHPAEPIFLISGQAVPGGARMVVLVSYDLGSTWRDYAASDVLPNAYRDSFYGLSATRRIAADATLYGTFTLVTGAGPTQQVFFFRVK